MMSTFIHFLVLIALFPAWNDLFTFGSMTIGVCSAVAKACIEAFLQW
jgi:hypothetical protein